MEPRSFPCAHISISKPSRTLPSNLPAKVTVARFLEVAISNFCLGFLAVKSNVVSAINQNIIAAQRNRADW